MSPFRWPVTEGSVTRLEKRRDVDGLLAALDHPKPEVAAAAAAALGRVGDPRALHQLLDHVAEQRMDVRRAAVKGLAALGDPGAARPLADRLAELWQAICSLAREVTEPYVRGPTSPRRVEAASAVDVLATDASAVVRAIEHLGQEHDLPLGPDDLHLLEQIAEEARRVGMAVQFYGSDHFGDLPAFLVAGGSAQMLGKDARSAADTLGRRLGASPAAAAGTRDVTVMVPCGQCGYRTDVTVRMDWAGRILSGTDFRCAHCGRTFTVPMEVLTEQTGHLV